MIKCVSLSCIPKIIPYYASCFFKDKRAKVTRSDGYQQIKLALPPPTAARRGLIFIDPSYEIKTDYQSVVKGLQEGYKRFATGIYAIWYPVIFRRDIKRLTSALNATGIRRILQIELSIKPDIDHLGMTGSGMMIINPPWILKEQMHNLLPWLHQKLADKNSGHTLVDWLVSE